MPIQYPITGIPTTLDKENNELTSSLPLGVGLNLSYPFTTQLYPFDTDKTTLQLAKSKIQLLLDVDLGEWRYKPDYGIGLKKYLFENITSGILSEIENDIKNQIEKWIPEAKLKRIKAQFDGKKLLTIDINYSLKEDARQSESITKEIEID